MEAYPIMMGPMARLRWAVNINISQFMYLPLVMVLRLVLYLDALLLVDA